VNRVGDAGKSHPSRAIGAQPHGALSAHPEIVDGSLMAQHPRMASAAKLSALMRADSVGRGQVSFPGCWSLVVGAGPS